MNLPENEEKALRKKTSERCGAIDGESGPDSGAKDGAWGGYSDYDVPRQRGCRRRILIADDEAHIRHVVSMKLANAGYETMIATDGEEALELALAERPDMIITDFQMPLLTGLELCMRLRENEATKDIPVLMLTARGFDIEEHEMSAAGIRDVLSKPFSPREVLRITQNMLEDSGRKSRKWEK